jgi:hypothetical protein
MARGNVRRLVPLTGALFVVLTVVSLTLGGESPDADDSPAEVVEYFEDNDTVNIIGSVLEAAGAVVLLFFAAYLARAVGGGLLAWVVLGGGIVGAAGIGVDAAIRFAVTEAAGEIDPLAVQTLNALWANFFFPMMVGIATLVFATSLSALRTRLLPAWLAWVGIIIFIGFWNPVGFIAFLVAGLWIIVISILLAVREPAASGVIRPAVGGRTAGSCRSPWQSGCGRRTRRRIPRAARGRARPRTHRSRRPRPRE